jgi:hypothetical protein
MVEIKLMREAALKITEADFYLPRQELAQKLHRGHPFIRTFRQLASALTQRSQESMEREAERSREAKEARSQQKMEQASFQDVDSTAKGKRTLSGVHMPSTIPVTPQKRNISDTPFGTRSTETTPTKLIKPETTVQELQNDLVNEIILSVYNGDIPIPWVRGRTLFLSYNSYMCHWNNLI